MGMRFSTFLSTVVAWASVASMLSCSDAGEPVTINERMLLREGDDLTPRGGGCSWMKLPSSGRVSSGGGSGDISFAEGPEGDTFVVRVFSEQEPLMTRSYSIAMLRSGQVDEFAVTTHSSAVYVFRYWGGICADLDASSP
jgi:hypothetical protein